MRRLVIAITLLSVLFPRPCLACLWDYETLSMERERFPEAYELIAGHFVRHSDAYYSWRIADRQSKPQDQRSPLDYDDIAVAYDKLGQHDKAAETIRAKMERWPDERRYESEANLGTFHIHAGRLEKGMIHIKKAIAINPNAHFGREIYQQLLVECLLEQKAGGENLPKSDETGRRGAGFGEFVLEHRYNDDKTAEIQAAVKGVLGMMRFGHYDSPILLKALGDLLTSEHRDTDAKMLGARAYLKASYSAPNQEAAAAYRKMAVQAIELQAGRELEELEAELKSEMAQARELADQIAADEQAWIAQGLDLDAEFAKKYFDAPNLRDKHVAWGPLSPDVRVTLLLSALLAGLIAFVALFVWAVKRALRIRRTTIVDTVAK